MPVRSLNSSVFRWPDARTVEQSLRRWTEKVVRRRTDVVRIGYFGSYARGDWGVGSDLDLIIIVAHSRQPFTRRSVEWDTTELAVPTDVLVYTEEEWRSLSQSQSRMSKQVMNWVYQRQSP
jgi:predicted nucleotidyltransferase